LQALRGIAEISAVTIVAELGSITRFENARQLMGYSGAVPSEDSSGQRTRRGSITKTGNAHLRRIVLKRLELSARPAIGPAAQTTRRSAGNHQGDRLEGTGRLTNAMPGWRRQARTSARSSPPWGANCWASSGHRHQSGSCRQTAIGSLTKCKDKSKGKSKNFPKNEKAKT